MRSAFATLALAAFAAANPVPQGVSSSIAPESSAPAGCSPSYDGKFAIQVVNVTQDRKRGLVGRQTDDLTITLSGGELMDDEGRTGYVASNSQFQFDDPPQAGAIYTAGFAVCNNDSLTIGGDAIWYSCLSGTFYNLYDDNVLSTGQCFPVYIQVVGNGGPSGGSSSAPASYSAPPATSAPAAPSSSGYASESSDGQITAPQVTSSVPVTQISDGQIQAPTSAVVTQISDGQIQAPTSVAACTQIVDGQPQCPTGSMMPSYMATGTGYGAASSYTGPAIATGAAAQNGMSLFGLAAGMAAVAMF